MCSVWLSVSLEEIFIEVSASKWRCHWVTFYLYVWRVKYPGVTVTRIRRQRLENRLVGGNVNEEKYRGTIHPSTDDRDAGSGMEWTGNHIITCCISGDPLLLRQINWNEMNEVGNKLLV